MFIPKPVAAWAANFPLSMPHTRARSAITTIAAPHTTMKVVRSYSVNTGVLVPAISRQKVNSVAPSLMPTLRICDMTMGMNTSKTTSMATSRAARIDGVL